MVARGTALPEKLNPDAILEAIFEVRFDAPTHLPEVLFGRLAEHPLWATWQQLRMPAYEIPAPLREADPNLRWAAIFELSNPQEKRAVRIGPHVMSYHVMSPYPGWANFQGEIGSAVDQLYSKAPGLIVTRLGLRYTNGFVPSKHGISSAADLDLKVEVSGDDQKERMNLNFIAPVQADSACMVRVASREFVQGPLPPEASLIVDVDVYTTGQFTATSADAVKQWALVAHEAEKQEFFHLLKPETIEALKGQP